MSAPQQTLTAATTVRFILGWLVQAARKRSWGELRIVVQDGQIHGVHEHLSYRGRLPETVTSQVADDTVQKVMAG